jgi:hypothetical protein
MGEHERDALDAEVRARFGTPPTDDDLPSSLVTDARRAAVEEIRRRLLASDPPTPCAEDDA